MFDKRVFGLVSGAAGGTVACVALRLCALAAQVVALVCIGRMLDGMLAESFDRVPSCACIAAVCAAASFALRAAATHVAAKTAAAATAAVRREVFGKLVRLGTGYGEHVSTSEAAQLMGEDAEQLAPYFSAYLPQFFYAVLAPLALCVYLCTASAPAALVLLACVVCMPVSIMVLMKRAKRFMGEYRGTYVDLGGAFLDALRGLTTLKVFDADGRAHERLNEQAEGFRRATMKLLRVQLGNVTFMDLFAYGGMAAGIAVAALQLAVHALSVGDAITVALIAPCFFAPMRAFGSMFHTGMNANAVIARVFEFLGAPEPDDGGAEDGAQPAGRVDEGAGIVCAGLGYAAGGTAVLRGVDMEVPAGTLVGVTGESGSGKTTLARLLAGECGGYTGSVTVGGRELRDMPRRQLQEAVTVVSQASHVFKGTIRSNLLLADPEAGDGQLWEALGKAQLAEFVLACGGLDMPVAEGGANLSGGQRQRLCFARAVLRDTLFYIFDEAASNVDAESEQMLLGAIQQLALTKTVVVITHRLSSLARADRVYVMEQGHVTECGLHGELLRAGGVYRALWERNAVLEELAARAAGAEVDEDERPDEAEKAMAAMGSGSMGALMMQMALDARKAQRYRNAGTGEAVAQGHPAWIPLPDYARYEAAESSGELAADDAPAGALDAREPRQRGTASVLAGMARLTRGQLAEQLGAVLLGAAGQIVSVALAAFSACAVLAACGAPTPFGLAGSLAAALACGVARGPLRYAERLLTHDQTFRTLACVRDRVFAALRRLAPAKLEQRGSGDLVALVTADVELLEGFYSRALTPLASTALTATLLVVCTCAVSLPLGMLALGVYLLVGAALPALAAALTRAEGRRLRTYATLMVDFLVDALSGMEDLLHFGRAHEFAEELDAHLDSLSAGEGGFARTVALLGALPRAFALLGTVAFSAVAVLAAAHGALPAALAFAMVLAFDASVVPVVSLGESGPALHQTLAAAERVLDVLEQRPETPDVSEGSVPGSFAGMQADAVSFAYGDQPVVRDLSAAVRPGRVVRVAGKSGAGKSTLVKLLMRFWDVDSGSIRISGQDLRAVNTHALRGLQAYMTQDCYLFAGTLRDNLLLAKPDASDGQLADAVERAALSRFVADLPEGLDTVLGAQGVQVSSGERQRIGLARVFLSDAPLLLLDEPTSNLDSLNEAAVLHALAQCDEDTTMVVVSHRPALAAIADDTITLRR